MEAAFLAQQIVRERQAQIAEKLSQIAIPFAVSGSNATFLWISSIDQTAARHYRNVEFIIERNDSTKAVSVLSQIGLIGEVKANCIMFRNCTTGRDRWSDKALFSGETDGDSRCKVPTLVEIEWLTGLPVVQLDRLVYFQLVRWTLDDRVDLRDMIEVGLLDATCLPRLPAGLAPRLKELLDNPDS